MSDMKKDDSTAAAASAAANSAANSAAAAAQTAETAARLAHQVAETINAKLDSIHTDVIEIKTKMPYLEAAITNMSKRVDRIDTRVNDHLENPSKWSTSGMALIAGCVALIAAVIGIFLALKK